MNQIELIDWFCLSDDLRTYDPYDIWKKGIGLKVKELYYQNKLLGFIPAGFLYLVDLLSDSFQKKIFTPQEYPMVRALASLALMACYKRTEKEKYLRQTKLNLDWLTSHYSKGFSGFCWGHNFKWASKNGTYDANTPFITVTPYVLEALTRYRELTSTKIFDQQIASIFFFIEDDLIRQIDEDNFLALSYAPINEPRIVINSNSYALFSYSLLINFFPQKQNEIMNKIERLHRFIIKNQNKDGSWFYYADKNSGNFIDCFHSCFILKNLLKASRNLPDFEIDVSTIKVGLKYLEKNFYNNTSGLFKRFSVTDLPSLIKYDLYDNAEMLNLYFLLNEKNKYELLKKNIKRWFLAKSNIYSKIDCMNQKRNRNSLRWAVMPYIYSLSLSL